MASDLSALDNPVWSALTGPQADLGAAKGLAAIYAAPVAPFAGLADASPAAFSDLATLADGRVLATLSDGPLPAPAGWTVMQAEPLEQHICLALLAPPPNDADVRVLTRADVPAMLALAEETKPGPFGPDTIHMGRYICIKGPDGGLAAMAGQRMRVAGAVEISAVCTAPAHRGLGLAGKLVSILAAEILSQGLTPFLNVRPANVSAVRLYKALGFRRRRTLELSILQAPNG